MSFQRILQKEWREILQDGRQIFNPMNILRALMALQVKTGIDVEVEVNRILAKATDAEHAFLILPPELDSESLHLVVRVGGDSALELPRALAPMSVFQIFYMALIDPQNIYLDQVDSTAISVFAQILNAPALHSLMCIPIHYPSHSGKVALFACLVNKSSKQEDGDHIRTYRRKLSFSTSGFVEEFDRQDEEFVKEVFYLISSLVISKLKLVDPTQLTRTVILDLPPQLLVETVHPEVILKSIVQQAWNLIDCQRCGLFLVKQNFLEGKIYEKIDDIEVSQRMMMPKNQGILGQVLGTRLVFNIRCSSPEPTLSTDLTHFSNAKSILCFPLLFKGHVLGVLDFCNKEGSSCFSLEDEHVAHVASVYCATAICHGAVHSLIAAGKAKFNHVHR